ncbi:adenylosuccinate lyase [Bdellovibrionota bacterium FG-2]
MIKRYTRAQMGAVWEDRHRYQVWLKVELAVCEALAREGVIPRKDWRELSGACERLMASGGVDPKRVEKLEAITRHDVIAFTTAVAEKVGQSARYIHFGLTSSDVVDTSLSLLIQEAVEILLEDVRALVKALRLRAREYKGLATIGRSHGIFAEPTSFGLKFLGWVCEWERNEARLVRALEGARFGKLSGAVGVSSHWKPAFEGTVLRRLGLNREPVSTQVVPRDRHAELFNVMALCGSSLERMAVEFRHLQRSEVGEVVESFAKGQKGSSAMPHKKNPISSENIAGCARLLRAYAQAALENVVLWHERDMSHSSVERVALPDATILLDYALHRMTGIVAGLEVRKDRVAANLASAGPTVFSGHILLELVKQGVSRESAYAWIQACALPALSAPSGEGARVFLENLKAHSEIAKRVSEGRLQEILSVKNQLRHVPLIFAAAKTAKKKPR